MNCPNCGKFMEQSIDWLDFCLVWDCWDCDERIVDYGEEFDKVLLTIKENEF